MALAKKTIKNPQSTRIDDKKAPQLLCRRFVGHTNHNAIIKPQRIERTLSFKKILVAAQFVKKKGNETNKRLPKPLPVKKQEERARLEPDTALINKEYFGKYKYQCPPTAKKWKVHHISNSQQFCHLQCSITFVNELNMLKQQLNEMEIKHCQELTSEYLNEKELRRLCKIQIMERQEIIKQIADLKIAPASLEKGFRERRLEKSLSKSTPIRLKSVM